MRCFYGGIPWRNTGFADQKSTVADSLTVRGSPWVRELLAVDADAQYALLATFQGIAATRKLML